MTNIYPNLAKKMAEYNTSVSALASLLNISIYSVYRRLRGYTEFKFIEIIKLCQFFKEPNVENLFVRFDNTGHNERCQENNGNNEVI